VTGTTITGNAAGSYGGGISANAKLTRSTVSGNTATTFGGGIQGGVNATGSRVTGNIAGGRGGGIFGVGTIATSTVRRNRSGADGGGIATTGIGDITIKRSTIAENDAAGANAQGGGVYFSATTFNLVNSTLAGNEATGWGGGLSSAAGTTNLQNTTINRNTADSDADNAGDGGGIDQASGATLNLKNTIVAGNRDATGQLPDCNGNSGVTSQGYNLFGTTTGCGVTLIAGDRDLAGANPVIGQLHQNGGPTPTSALLPGSPAINAGNPATPGSGGTACAAIDQRGVHRPQGPRCDIGAFEFARPEIAIKTPADNAHYRRGARVLASYSCSEAGFTSFVASCLGTVRNGKRINTATLGKRSFTVTATDGAGNRTVKTVHYRVVS
jgi:hypothetical protein